MNSDSHPDAAAGKIACQQVLAEDDSVFSLQRVMLPSTLHTMITADKLLRLYLDYLHRVTLGIIRVNESAAGVELRLAVCRSALISFAPPFFEQGPAEERIILRICGGLLVQPLKRDCGELEFRVERVAGGIRLTLQLADYFPLLLGGGRPPRLRRRLYRFTQAYVHRAVTVRFLRLVYRQLAGEEPAAKTAAIVVTKGDNI